MPVVIGVQKHPEFIVRLVVELQQTIQHVRRGGGAVCGRNDMDLHAREPEEIEILFWCEGVVARHDKQTVVPQSRALPG